MKPSFLRAILLIALLLSLAAPAAAVSAQETTEEPTQTATVQPVPEGARPIVVVQSYRYGDRVTPGTTFDLHITLSNQGDLDAANVLITFTTDGFIPLETGGVIAIPAIAGRDQSGNHTIRQPLLAQSSLWGNGVGLVVVNISYTDYSGTPYQGSYTFSINLTPLGPASANPTATPTAAGRAQIVVGGYDTDIETLQPGSIFNLQLDVNNLGVKDARNVSMVLGGGTASNDNGQGTPIPGGVSGAGADLSTFAPLGSSNVVFIGDIAAGASLKTDSQLITNVTANPGAYPFKISFIYTDEKGNRVTEDQVITLLVYRLPQVEVSFYTDPGFFTAGMPMPLPLQVTNLGRSTAVLGTMRVSSEGGEVMNNQVLVGALEPGGYYPLDAMFTPFAPGPQEIIVTISYTDDFNQPREVTQTLNVEVMEGMPIDPGLNPDGTPIDPGSEGIPPDGGPIDPGGSSGSLWDTIVRFFKGLFGLDSGPETDPGMPVDPGLFPEGEPIPNEGKPISPPKG